MADVIGVSYLTIAKAALIPSVLYYLTLLAIIHLEAVSKNMGTLPPELVPARLRFCAASTTCSRWCS